MGGKIPDRLPFGDADTPVQHHPGLPDFCRPAEHTHPLGKQGVHAEAGGFQPQVHEGFSINDLQFLSFHEHHRPPFCRVNLKCRSPKPVKGGSSIFNFEIAWKGTAPRAFANRLELGWDNPQSAGDFPRSEGRPSCYSPVHFSGGLPPLFPAISNRTGTQNSRLFCKRWEQRLFIVFPIRDRAGSGRSSSPLPLRKRGRCGIIFSYNTLPKEADYCGHGGGRRRGSNPLFLH